MSAPETPRRPPNDAFDNEQTTGTLSLYKSWRLGMSIQVTYSYARQNLASLLNEAEDTQEPVIITRRGREDMALIPATELTSLEETAHLLRSPANARHLLRSLHDAFEDRGVALTQDELRREVGLDSGE